MPRPFTFIYTAPNQNVTTVNDINILSQYGKVIWVDMQQDHSWLHYRYFGTILRGLVSEKADVLICDGVMAKITPLIATVAKFLRCKVLIIIFGIEVAYVPELNYGEFLNP